MLVASCVAPGKPEILHDFDHSEDERRRRHGTGTHTPPGELTAGEPATIEFLFEIGEEAVRAGGELLIAWRWPFDWGALQFDDPSGEGYTRIEFLSAEGRDAPDNVELVLRYEWIGGVEPWHHQLAVRVSSGRLEPGDRVRIVCGERSHGGAGWPAPTCAVRRCGFLMLVDHDGTGRRHRLVDPPTFPIVVGRPARLVAVAGSDAVVNEPVELLVRAEDRWGNPALLPSSPAISAATIDGEVAAVTVESVEAAGENPVRRFRVMFPRAGTFRLQTECAHSDLSALSNPVTVHEQAPERQLFWGDLHSGQTEIGCGCGTLAEHYAFARDQSGLQFVTHQANDHYVTLDEWNHTRRVTDEFYQPGRFVPFLGCEWSPPTRDGGDRNVIYRHDEPVLRRSGRFFRESQPDPEPDIPTAPEFHQAFRDRAVLVNLHVGGRMTNLDWHEPGIERLCEVHSTHGTSEWFVFDALARGYRVGLTAGTDGVMGRPGACHPGRRLIRNLRNGLTAVYAGDLTRESLWEALRNRRCYATTGERIRLWFDVDGHPMGSRYETSGSPTIHLHVQGTAALERIDLFRGRERIGSWMVAPAEVDAAEPVLRILWGGTERRGTARLQRVCWDGGLTMRSGTGSAGGTLRLVETINFSSCEDTARSVDAERIAWSSSTAGNAAGILVQVSGNESAELTFHSGPCEFRFGLKQVVSGEMTVDAGGVGRFVSVGPAPRQDGPTEFSLTTCDAEPLYGEFPYWVRVVQVDQARAWSSPVYVVRSASVE